MTSYLLCVALSQAPLVYPCGGVASCTAVGVPDGGQVQLGAVLQSSRYATPDGGSGQVRLQPLTTGLPVAVLGNQGRTATQPDVIIGGLVARDGGQGPIISIRSGSYEIATISGNGTYTSSTSIRVAGSGTLVYDFPPLPTSGELTAGNNICAESIAATATGCAFSDKVVMGIDQALPNAFGLCSPYVSATNAVKVRCCGFLNDAGSFDMPDASYAVSCLR